MKTIQSVLEKFDEEFTLISENNDDGGHYSEPLLNTKNPNLIKIFLIQSLADLIEEEGERIKEKIPKRTTEYETHNTYNDGVRDALEGEVAHLTEVVKEIRSSIKI